ncbi:MAG TPA: YihY/virulence factor BrkB family protein [Abditibacteriaceae bacterium]|jgi:membrane protein
MNATILKSLPGLLKDTYTAWNEDKAPRLGAALAYYTVFSMAPFLIVLLAIAGLVFDQAEARTAMIAQISSTMGKEGAEAIETMINNANHKGSGIVATIIGGITLLLGAGGLFGQLQDALNTIWGVAPKPGLGFGAMLKARFLSFGMVLGTGFLLLVSLVLSTVVDAMGKYMTDVLPIPVFAISALHFILSVGIITLLFAVIFKVLPDAEIQWHDVWVGGAMTALLFTIGKFGLAFYLARSAPGSTYGAAGSLVLILLWVYYAAQILFFGAEFTQVFATKFGSRIVPSPNAVAVTADAFARQGILRGTDEEMPTGSAVVVPHLAPNNSDFIHTELPKSRQNEEPDWGFLAAALLGFAGILSFSSWRTRRAEDKIAEKAVRDELAQAAAQAAAHERRARKRMAKVRRG